MPFPPEFRWIKEENEKKQLLIAIAFVTNKKILLWEKYNLAGACKQQFTIKYEYLLCHSCLLPNILRVRPGKYITISLLIKTHQELSQTKCLANVQFPWKILLFHPWKRKSYPSNISNYRSKLGIEKPANLHIISPYKIKINLF